MALGVGNGVLFRGILSSRNHKDNAKRNWVNPLLMNMINTHIRSPEYSPISHTLPDMQQLLIDSHYIIKYTENMHVGHCPIHKVCTINRHVCGCKLLYFTCRCMILYLMATWCCTGQMLTITRVWRVFTSALPPQIHTL